MFQLATTVLFQNPVQNFALAPNNLKDVPAVCMDFMKRVPTTWDETRFVDGYPGKYVVLARRQGAVSYTHLDVYKRQGYNGACPVRSRTPAMTPSALPP